MKLIFKNLTKMENEAILEERTDNKAGAVETGHLMNIKHGLTGEVSGLTPAACCKPLTQQRLHCPTRVVNDFTHTAQTLLLCRQFLVAG